MPLVTVAPAATIDTATATDGSLTPLVRARRERLRGCGWREVNKLYLTGEPDPALCKRLPGATTAPFSLGVQWRPLGEIAAGGTPCAGGEACAGCILSAGRAHELSMLMWVGAENYSPEEFVAEAERMGISKKIPGVPADFRPGQLVLLAHRRAMPPEQGGGAGIFYAFRAARIEMLVEEARVEEDWVSDLRARGVQILVVEDRDPLHAARAAAPVPAPTKQGELPPRQRPRRGAARAERRVR